MAKYLVLVDYDGGDVEEPMDEWAPGDVAAHFRYYDELTKELRASGEMIGFTALTDRTQAKVVRSDGKAAAVVTDGPFAESKEVLAGFNVLDVESEERALEIAARISAVPGPGGVPTRQPVQVRRVMDEW